MNHRVIIMHGMDNVEIDLVMRAVKNTLNKERDTIFAKTTANNLKMKLGDLIEDVAGDHEYLKENPPKFDSK